MCLVGICIYIHFFADLFSYFSLYLRRRRLFSFLLVPFVPLFSSLPSPISFPLSFVVLAFLFVAGSVFYSSFIWPYCLIRGPLICLVRPTTSLIRERADGLLELEAVCAEVKGTY